MNVIEYITEEVRRQGHDVTQREGLERVAWMLEAWGWSLAARKTDVTVANIENIGRSVERVTNGSGFRTENVIVGGHRGSLPQSVRAELVALIERRDALSPLDFYREFELIHPFLDGNGRTGKILLNILNGTMHDPIFPPNDFWGREIQNP